MASVFDVILEDHKRCRQMLVDLIDEMPSEIEELENLTNDLVVEVRSHARSEEQAFYEVIKEKADREDEREVYEFEDQHSDIEQILNFIHNRSSFGRDFRNELLHLYEALEAHWTQEETDLFSRAKKLISAQEAEELGEMMLEIRHQIQSELRRDMDRVSDGEYEGFATLSSPPSTPNEYGSNAPVG